MVSIDSTNSSIRAEIEAQKKHLSKYLAAIKKSGQGFYKCIDDKENLQKIKNFAAKNRKKFEHIVVLGIGGSALGAICLQQALKHLSKLYVLDNIDPALIREIENTIDYKKTLFLVVTKSGETIETLSQYYYFRKKIEQKNLDPKKHFVFITDHKKGQLREIAIRENFRTFDVPENVGGRFSVLTAVGLLPAALIGIDIEKLLKGARRMRNQFLNTNFAKNSPFKLAAIQYLLSKKSKNINVLMPYSQKLIRLADWYRQLLAESIGKKLDRHGQAIFAGITPINALGATDQHSQLQLYNEGPNDKLIIFIEVKNLGPEVKIPSNGSIKNLSFNKLIQIEKSATEASLTKNNRPNITIKVDQINEETLGELFMFFEGSVAFLGEFYNVNAFDQPGVEYAKQLINKHLF